MSLVDAGTSAVTSELNTADKNVSQDYFRPPELKICERVAVIYSGKNR